MATIILGAQSNVWTQLTLPNPPSGAVPFVWTDNTTIAADPVNFNYDSVGQVLTVTNGLKIKHTDNTGTPGAPVVTANTPSGVVEFITSQTSIVILNSLVAAGDIVIVQANSVDAGVAEIATNTATGQIGITLSGTVTGPTYTISWILFKVF